MDDAAKALRSHFPAPGREVYLLGAPLEQGVESLAGSEYLETGHGMVAGLPRINLEAERRLHQLVLRAHAEGLLASAHDCSEGGLAIAIAEAAILGDQGFSGSIELSGRLDSALFGEGQGRIVVSLTPGSDGRLAELGAEIGASVTRLGETSAGDIFSFGPIVANLSSMREAYESLF
jgi:phosphoribosylformylglycinamidine synthase